MLRAPAEGRFGRSWEKGMHDLRPPGRHEGGTLRFVGTLAARDVVWRARRWVIAVVGTAIALSVTILLSAFLASFQAEVDETLDILAGDGYLVRAGSAGPFTTPAPLDGADQEVVARLPGVEGVVPLVTLPHTLREPGADEVTDIFLVGRSVDAPVPWPLHDGRAPTGPGEVVTDSRIDADVGDTVVLGDRPFTVVGTTRGVHVLAGKGAAWTTVEEAQQLVFAGAPLVSAFLYEGRPETVPPGMVDIDRKAAEGDLLRPVEPVVQSIETFRILMWIVAAAVVGSVLYLTAVDRVRDFAVLKATGARNVDLAASLVLQAAVLAVAASTLGIGFAFLLAPTFPTPVLFTAPLLLTAPVVAVVIGALGSLAGVRRARATDPALAFGGA